jgi:ribosomal protein S18 acetylase RimI-like enzyme
VLVDPHDSIAGYYTLAYGHVRLDQLPPDVARKLPDQLLPVVVLAWLGVDQSFKGQGLGEKLLAHALARCLDAMRAVSYVAVVVDCLNESARAFFMRFQFSEFPGHPMKLLLPRALLEAMAA